MPSTREFIKSVNEAHALGMRLEPEGAKAEPTVDAMIKAFVADRRRALKPRTLESVSISLSLFVAWARLYVGRATLPASVLSKTLLADWWTHCRHERKNSDATSNMRTRHVTQWWAWAGDHDEYDKFVPRPRKIDLPEIVSHRPGHPPGQRLTPLSATPTAGINGC